MSQSFMLGHIYIYCLRIMVGSGLDFKWIKSLPTKIKSGSNKIDLLWPNIYKTVFLYRNTGFHWFKQFMLWPVGVVQYNYVNTYCHNIFHLGCESGSKNTITPTKFNVSWIVSVDRRKYSLLNSTNLESKLLNAHIY